MLSKTKTDLEKSIDSMKSELDVLTKKECKFTKLIF